MNEKAAWGIFANVVASTQGPRAIELRVQSVLVKEMFRPAELVDRIRRLVRGRPPVIIPALDSTFGAYNPELPLSPEAAGGWAAETSVHGPGRNFRLRSQ